MKLETETEVRSKNTPAINTYAIGAAKDNKMKIFQIISLNAHNNLIQSSAWFTVYVDISEGWLKIYGLL